MIRITDKKNRERLLIFLYFFYLCPNTKNTHKIMKKLFILFTLLLQLLSPIYPQQAATVITPSLKYGKPSKEELLFTTYTPDTSSNLYPSFSSIYTMRRWIPVPVGIVIDRAAFTPSMAFTATVCPILIPGPKLV